MSNSAFQFYKLVDDCMVCIDAKDWRGPQQLGDKTIRGVRVSTVFLGTDHFGGMFETMVFGGPADGFMMRYQTVEKAKEGHEKIVDIFRAPNWLLWHLDGNITERIRKQLVELLPR